MRKLIYISSVWLLLWAQIVFATASAIERPDLMLDSLTKEMIQNLKKENTGKNGNTKKIAQIIEHVLVPHVESTVMAKWVVGKNGWLKANEAQRNSFIQELKSMVVRTYSVSLASYNNQTIEYSPVAGGYANKKRVIVSSVIKEPGKEPIKIAYRMLRKGDAWKVYDINIEGVSLLQGFKSQFKQDIQKNGIQGAIDKIKQHNAKMN